MTRSGAEILPIKSSDELDKAWREIDYDPPGGEDVRQEWLDMVGKDRHDFLIARLGEKAIGFVVIRWAGPVSFEPQLTEALNTAFPGQDPIPTIYSLRATPEYRGNRIGWDLMEAAEQQITDRDDVTQRAALSVEVDNQYALPIFINTGYKVLPYKYRYVAFLHRPADDHESSSDKPVYFMTKDLSKLS